MKFINISAVIIYLLKKFMIASWKFVLLSLPWSVLIFFSFVCALQNLKWNYNLTFSGCTFIVFFVVCITWHSISNLNLFFLSLVFDLYFHFNFFFVLFIVFTSLILSALLIADSFLFLCLSYIETFLIGDCKFCATHCVYVT